MNKKFQVFVSSTYSDLIIERQACVEAILMAGHIPAGMELFSAGSETQLDTIKRWIDESDIYMLLLGGRYGSLEPKSGVSYTEIEYRYAVDSGKPHFALIMSEELLDEKVKNNGKEVLERNNSAKYNEFKQFVLSKISKFFSNQDQLKLATIQSLYDIQARHSLTGWVKANESVDSSKVLNQLSELTERNKALEIEIKILKEREILSENLNISEAISAEAKELLIHASENEGRLQIITSPINGFMFIQIQKKHFPHEALPKLRAMYEAGFEELLQYNLIKQIGNNTSMYRLTKVGYETVEDFSNIKLLEEK